MQIYIQSQPGLCIRSRPAFRLHSLTDLTSLATFRLSVSPRQGSPFTRHPRAKRLVYTPQTQAESAMRTMRYAVTVLRGITLAVAVRM